MKVVRRYDLSLGLIHFDRAQKSGVFATMTDEGFIRGVAHGTRANAVFTYQDADGNEWGELRTADEVFSEKSLGSYELAPMTDDHPAEFVSAENAKELSVGTIGKAEKDGDFVRFPFVIMDKEAIHKVVNGKAELSMGYTTIAVSDEGELDGAKYKFRQTGIQINHCAVVDRGRAGPDCRIPPLSQRGDAFEVEGGKGTDMKTRKIKIGDAEFIVPEQYADALLKSKDATLALAMEIKADGHPDESEDSVEVTIKGKKFKVSKAVAAAMGEGGEEGEDGGTVTPPEKPKGDADPSVAAGRIAALEAARVADEASFHSRVDARTALVNDARLVLGNDFITRGVSDVALMRAVIDEVAPHLKAQLDVQKKDARTYPAFLQGAYQVALDLHKAKTDAVNESNRTIFSTLHDDGEDETPDAIYTQYLDKLSGKKPKPSGKDA